MTPEVFRVSAETLFGGGWQTPLSLATGIAPRTIRRMASGAQPIPPKLDTALARAHEVMNLIEELTAEHGAPGQIDLTTSSDDQLTLWVRSIVIEALEGRA
jgi:hypothetical protein